MHFVLVFLDDILVFSKTQAEHLMHLGRVLEKLRENHLYARKTKCTFCTPEVEYLGHVIGKEGIKVCQDKVKAIVDWPRLTTMKEVRAFVGMASFYRRFIRSFSRISHPLTDLTRKSVSFEWTPVHKTAFEVLKGHSGRHR